MFFTKNVYFFYFFCPNGQISKTKELSIQKIWFAKLFNDVGLTTIAMWECAFIYIYNKLWILDNWNKFKSFIYISLLFYNLISKAICSDCTDFCLQIFVHNCVFWKKEKTAHKTFHILKMKTHFEEEPHFGNKSSFQNPFWKWKCFHFQNVL